MKELKTMRLLDAETQQSAIAVIRAGNGIVGLTLSSEGNGDVEVFLSVEDCRKLAAELQNAISAAS